MPLDGSYSIFRVGTASGRDDSAGEALLELPTTILHTLFTEHLRFLPIVDATS